MSWVAPLVEFTATTSENADDGLTCQLYATIPAGSVTADQEIVQGSVTCAAFAGVSGVGAASPVGAGVVVGVGATRGVHPLRVVRTEVDPSLTVTVHVVEENGS